MATIVTKIIDPDAGGGYDYLSLNAWQTAQVGNLTGVRDEIAHASCRNTSGGADTNELYLTGWTTSATQYIWIDGAAGYRANASWNDAKFRMNVTDAYARCFRINQRHVRIEHIQIRQGYAGALGDCQVIFVGDISALGSSDIRIIGNFIRGNTSNTSTSAHGIEMDGFHTDSVTYIVNNCFGELGQHGIVGGFYASNRGTLCIYNNTLCLMNTGISIIVETNTEGELSLYNNLGINNSVDYVLTGCATYFSTYVHDNNLSSDTTSPDAAHQSKSIVFVDESSFNYNLAAGDTDAIDDGTSMVSDTYYPFANDINEFTRAGTWDIGAMEYGATGDPALSVYDGVVLSENITVEPAGFYFGHNTRFTGSTDDLTQAFTCEANAKILTLGIVVGGSTNREAVAPTYNGVNLTQADITRKYATSPEESCELWYLIDPPTGGSYNIVVPNSGTVALYVQACSWRVSGLGDALLDNATGTTGLSANPTVNITPTVNGALIVAVLGDGRNAAPTAQTGYNINRTLNSTFSDSNQYYLQTTAALWACTWTCLSDDWCLCVAAFKLSLGISVADCIQAIAVFGRN